MGHLEHFLHVVENCENLAVNLRKLFPNARIRLFNVLPRSYTCVETRNRISLFNTIFDEHVSRRMKGVSWLRLYWEFLDNYGYLRDDLYGRNGVHLKGKGKSIMARCIKNFQRSYN